jgi:hypothetical protein
MTDALLAADQSIDEQFLTVYSSYSSDWSCLNAPPSRTSVLDHLHPFGRKGAVLSPESLMGEADYGRYRADPSIAFGLVVKESSRGTRPQDARHALDCLRKVRKDRESRIRREEEAAWIAANAARFAGRWIALLGGQLLAVGDSAREVFDKSSTAAFAPLVIHLPEGDLPFAGW